MKTWLTKLKISNALNDHRPLPPAVERAIRLSEKLRRFAENANALDHALKKQLPRLEPTAPLHAAIMRAVRAERPAPVAETGPFWWRWIPAAGLALLMATGIFLTLEFSAKPAGRVPEADAQALATAGLALEAGGSLISEAPDVALSPLSDEMQKLNHHLVNTGQFLLASLP
jgi:hypothetical protein